MDATLFSVIFFYSYIYSVNLFISFLKNMKEKVEEVS